jgi:WD40-like Beta Propeller Repeat
MKAGDLMVLATSVVFVGSGATGRDDQRTPEPAGTAMALTTSPAKPPYLGQPLPGLTPERFAPGIVSTDAIELNAVFSPDGREFYFTRIVDGLDTMNQMTLLNGTWGKARELKLFADSFRVESADMVLSSDGQELYFLARYDGAGTGPAANYDLWVSRRVSGVWSPAELVGPPISTAANELYPRWAPTAVSTSARIGADATRSTVHSGGPREASTRP